MKTNLIMPLFVAGLMAVGCVPEVLDEAGSNTNQNLEGGGAGGPGTEPEIHDAVAMTRAQLDILWDAYWDENQEGGSTTSSGGGGDLDPNDLFVEISDQGALCSSPMVDLSCGGHWSVSVALPPAYQAVGIYDLEDPAIMAYSGMSETGEAYSSEPGDCSWGGGSLGTGTIEVISIDQHNIRFVLDMDPLGFSSDPSGEYTAALCAQ